MMNNRIIASVYFVLLGLSSAHLYYKPIYNMDAIQYIGNALLMEEPDIVKVHERVYAELRGSLPPNALQDLLGNRVGEPEDQALSRHLRANDAYHFAEFLPFFAIRPLYNQILWAVSKAGIGLVRSAILISVISYFLMGTLLFFWMLRYTNAAFGAALSLLLMISPPLTELGRDLTSDALATLVALVSLYFVFEKRSLAAGLTLLLVSIFFRTDFVVLAGPVLLVCWLERRIDIWKVLVLSLVAVGSVLTINHFSGDYGIKMLYYRNFVGVPIAPAEVSVQFTVRDYAHAFRSGITLVLNSFFIPFLALGLTGLTERRVRNVFCVTLAYVALHFCILPNWQERWTGVFYLCCGVCAAANVGRARRDTAALSTNATI